VNNGSTIVNEVLPSNTSSSSTHCNNNDGITSSCTPGCTVSPALSTFSVESSALSGETASMQPDGFSTSSPSLPPVEVNGSSVSESCSVSTANVTTAADILPAGVQNAHEPFREHCQCDDRDDAVTVTEEQLRHDILEQNSAAMLTQDEWEGGLHGVSNERRLSRVKDTKSAVESDDSDIDLDTRHKESDEEKPDQKKDEEEEEKQIDVSPNQRFLKFDKNIGRGSFKTVFKGLDTETGVHVAWCELQVSNVTNVSNFDFN